MPPAPLWVRLRATLLPRLPLLFLPSCLWALLGTNGTHPLLFLQSCLWALFGTNGTLLLIPALLTTMKEMASSVSSLTSQCLTRPRPWSMLPLLSPSPWKRSSWAFLPKTAISTSMPSRLRPPRSISSGWMLRHLVLTSLSTRACWVLRHLLSLRRAVLRHLFSLWKAALRRLLPPCLRYGRVLGS